MIRTTRLLSSSSSALLRRPAALLPSAPHLLRPLSGTPHLHNANDGRHARTDPSIEIENLSPTSDSVPSTPRAQGRGAFKRTLASFSLEGKTVVVTGGARGLGLVMTQGLIASGANVAIVDLNLDEAEKQAQGLREGFRRDNEDVADENVPTISAHYADVSSPSSVQSSITSILSTHNNKIDSLVTSAGFTENFPAISYPFERMQKIWGVNIDGTYLFAQAVAKHLIERQAKGSLVFIGSMSGSIVNVPQPQAPYNAAKAAVRQLAASMAVEWAKDGIRVNCISPGYMLTALTKKIFEGKPELREKWESLTPMGKMGDPSDLIGPVTFLVSDASGYMTGADLRVDGGYTAT